MKTITIRSLSTLCITFFLGACASIPQDGGISEIETLVEEKLGKDIVLPMEGIGTPLTGEQIDQMISGPLSLVDAERLSLDTNPSLKARLAQVGVAEADYAQAGRIENPGFSYERFSSEDYSSTLLFDIGGVLLMPLKREIQSRRLEMARYEAAADVLDHIADTRRAWVNAVSQRHQTNLMEQALESAQADNNLKRQMAALGHSGVIEAAQSEIFLGEMKTTLTKQRLAEGAAREALIRQLGLWGKQARSLVVPIQLPSLPDAPLNIPSVEQQAVENRLDVQMAKLNLESMAKNLKLARLNPFFSAVELGPSFEAAERENERGFEIEFRIPIFDTGSVQKQKLRFIAEQAQAQAQTVSISAASTAREAWSTYRSSYDIAEHYRDSILPLRRRISQEQILQYNGMLISVFDLLDDVRVAMQLESDYVDALRDFWLADTDLQQALVGSGTSPMNFEGSAAIPAAVGGGDH